ncbi:MAG: hypothetical protein H6700_12240 [Myxococcales bacterium]|nr:hypothetical protein [Myxococcales bacterium]
MTAPPPDAAPTALEPPDAAPTALEPPDAAPPGAAATATEPPEATHTPPWWRNPYLIAFVVGAVTLTLLRPRLRHVPDPPAVLARLPVVELVDVDDAPVSWGPATVVTFVGAGVDADCGGVEVASKVAASLRTLGVEIDVATVVIGAPADAKQLARWQHRAGGARAGWRWVAARDAEGAAALTATVDDALRVRAARAAEQRDRHAPRDVTPQSCAGPEALRWTTIVDADRQLRGLYEVDWEDIEGELLNRAQHVAARFDPSDATR